MINHARTLLLNRDGSATGYLARAGEEFIEPQFRAVVLPSYLVPLRQVLFGHRPDWLFENYRVRQYLALLHTTELVEFVTQLDQRLTYDVNNPDLFRPAVFGVWVETGAEAIRFTGRQPAPDADGQALRRWQLTVTGADTLEIERLGLAGSQLSQTFQVTHGWSDFLPLGSPALQYSVQPVLGRSWLIYDTARPMRSLGEIAAEVDQLGGERLSRLFGEGTPAAQTEPWQTFRNLWHDHPLLPYRLGGLLLALVWRTEEARNRA
jgi:hypothetical protein